MDDVVFFEDEEEEITEAEDSEETEQAEESVEAEEVEEDESFYLEFSEDDIYAYLYDEDDNEIGFVIMNENGEEEEYYYAEDDEEEIAEEKKPLATKVGEKAREKMDEYDLGITREGVAEATVDMNAIYKDGAAIAKEFKGAFDDIAAAFDFSTVGGKAKK